MKKRKYTKKPKSPGRKPKFETPEEMEKAVKKYFKNCDKRTKEVYDKKSGVILELKDPEPYTMAGLAYALGMERTVLFRYSQKDGFLEIIKDARNKVQADVERRLMEGMPAGAIFNLKNNFGYADQYQQDLTTKGEKLGTTVYMPEPLKDDNKAT